MDFPAGDSESEAEFSLSEIPVDKPEYYIDDGEEYFNDNDYAIFASGNKLAIAKMILSKSKKCAAGYLKDEVLNHSYKMRAGGTSQDLVLYEILDLLLDPRSDMNCPKTITWLKWLLAGGATPRDFFKTVEQYDNPTTCSRVWVANFMAYRCRTCGISPCMSLCLDCFKRGNHQDHDFNMFRSQAGGACDCGNRAVMKESGFCCQHKGSSRNPVKEPPAELLIVTKYVLPRLLQRFIFHCRFNGVPSSSERVSSISEDKQEDKSPKPNANTNANVNANGNARIKPCNANARMKPFVEFLQELCCLGGSMRKVMTQALCDPEIYSNWISIRPGMKFHDEMLKSMKHYYEAIDSLLFGEVPQGYEDVTTLHGPLIHNTFLDEILFWMLKYEFPQQLVCLLLNMRPDPIYEDAFARAFVQHYSLISVILMKTEETDPVSHRVVHVSVQLFSDKELAYQMVESFHLLHIMVVAVKKMMNKLSIPSTLHDMENNTHKVVDCSHELMKHHCYWPLVSDLNNILSHEPIAKIFLSEERLLREWFSFLSYFQGMNNNFRELNKHLEIEPYSYYAAFSAELEVSASPLWALVSHLKDKSLVQCTLNVLRHCVAELRNWFKEIGFTRPDRFHRNETTFHLPLHRNFALFLYHAVFKQGVALSDVLPDGELVTLMLVHPLRAHVTFHEIINGLWVRNGLQIRGQAMTYIQCHFCNSMFDPDLFLLQLGAGELPKDSFLLSIIERFHVLKNLSFSMQPPDPDHDHNDVYKMLDACLVFLCILMTNRHNLGLKEEEIAEREIVALICTSDKTHSKLMEYVPEKCVTNPNIDFEAIVKRLTKYVEPECQKYGTMREGLYVPRYHVWEELYDPTMISTRCMNKKEYQSALTRFKSHFERKIKEGYPNYDGRKILKGKNLWPPYRLPTPVHPSFKDPRRVLACRTFHGILFTLLYKAVNEHTFTDKMLSLVIFLLELTVDYQLNNKDGGDELAADLGNHKTTECPDGFFYLWYSTDNIFKNSCTVINRILLNNYITMQDSDNGNEADSEDYAMDEIENTGEGSQLELVSSTVNAAESLAVGNEMVPYQDSDSASLTSYTPEDYADFSQGDDDFQMREIEGADAVSRMQLEGPTANASRALSSGTEIVKYKDSVSPSSSSNTPSRTPRLLQGNEIVPYEERNSSLEPLNIDCGEDFLIKPSCSSDTRPIYHTRRSTTLPVAAGHVGSVNELQYNVLMDTSHNESVQAANVSKSENSGRRGRSREYLNVKESMISLILKLYVRVRDGGELFDPQLIPPKMNSRIGDGTLQIRKILFQLSENSEDAKKQINELFRKALVERPIREEGENKNLRSSKKNIKSWKQALQNKYTKMQNDFAKKHNLQFSETVSMKQVMHKISGCVICNAPLLPQLHTEKLGLMTYLQVTNIHGSKPISPHEIEIPLNDKNRARLKNHIYKCYKHMKTKSEMLNQYFDLNSWLPSMDLFWESGIRVVTCGHYTHFNCHNAYIRGAPVLPPAQGNESEYVEAKIENGEFHCHVCRRIKNCILPVLIHNVHFEQNFKASVDSSENILLLIDEALKNMVQTQYNEILSSAISRSISIMKAEMPEKYHTLPMRPEVSLMSQLVFLSSVFRTNLELELIARDCTLVNHQEYSNDFNRSALIPLLYVLAEEAKTITLNSEDDGSLNPKGPDSIRKVWSSLTQYFNEDFGCRVSLSGTEVPLLLRDPVTILIHFLLLLPPVSIKAYFKHLVYYIYRLVVVKAAISTLRLLPKGKRNAALVEGPLAPLLSMVYNHVCSSALFTPEFPSNDMSPGWESTCEVRESCLVFLRLASILKSFLLDEELPDISDPIAECGTLEQYLGVWDKCSVVNTTAMGSMCGSLRTVNLVASNQTIPSPGASCVETQVGELSELARAWCSDLAPFIDGVLMIPGILLADVRFYKPCLLKFPPTYDDIFQFYHQRKCPSCNSLPINPGLCLVCGALVSMQQPCCLQSRMEMCLDHASDCGTGTGVFLVILKAIVIVLVEDRICLWGCIHLDSYGEEDKDLKRGKTLYLSQERYQLLQNQYLKNSFLSTPHTWVQHMPSVPR